MEYLEARIYNVRFGDAILLSVPDLDQGGAAVMRHVLIDVGNVLMGEGGIDEVFEPVIRDVLEVLAGEPLDLYVLTHEHMDHVQGLPWAAMKLRPPLRLTARQAWLTASTAADYYLRFPGAKKKLLAYEQVERFLAAMRADGESVPTGVDTMMVNNNPRSTRACLDYLRGLAERTTYVFRGCDLAGSNPFRDAELEIWAPEEDTSEYFRPPPPAAGVETSGPAPRLARPGPPPGVHPKSFHDLVEARRRGYFEHLMSIDRAANNTSVVFRLRWRGWNLLFPGDAELLSWRTMAAKGMLEPVHFLKVSHHGSGNGTPQGRNLESILPATPPDGRQRAAAISTYPGVFSGVPDDSVQATLDDLGLRTCRTNDPRIGLGGHVAFRFPAEGREIGVDFVAAGRRRSPAATR